MAAVSRSPHVVVTDTDDAPVRDLDDFEITESGRPQKVADFTFVSIPLGTRVVDVAAAPVGGRREATVDTTLSLDELSPGPHVLSVVVETANGKRAIRSVPFTIRGR